MITKFAAGVVALILVAQVYAADLPRHAMQVIKEEDGRKAVFLEHGDVLQVVIPNGSGNFASDVKVDLGKSPLKLIRSVRVEYRGDEGERAIGGGEIAYFFETTKVGSGELTITAKRMFDRGDKPLKLRVTVEQPSNPPGAAP